MHWLFQMNEGLGCQTNIIYKINKSINSNPNTPNKQNIYTKMYIFILCKYTANAFTYLCA